jgi:hypothetical protein
MSDTLEFRVDEMRAFPPMYLVELDRAQVPL